jgi:hypothetical protein
MTDQPEDTKPQIEYESVPVQQPPSTLEKLKIEIDRVGFQLADNLDKLITRGKADWPEFEKQVRYFFSREFWDKALTINTKPKPAATTQESSNSTEENIHNEVPDIQSSTPPIKTVSVDVNNLGNHLDGWADLLEGMGEKVNEVQQFVLNSLIDREMPQIQVYDVIGHTSITSNERRPYLLATTYPGATTAIYIQNHGKDLYVSWRTFLKRNLNWGLILMIAGIAFLIGFVFEVVLGSNSSYYRQTVSIYRIIYVFLIVLILEVIVVGIVGRIKKRNFWSYFYIEPNLFDAEDITAMSLSAHKSLIRALDSVGIDATKLRLKQNFKGGRWEEDL